MSLILAEELLLLALHDEKGSVIFNSSTALPYGLSGAIILELFMKKRLMFVDKKITVADTTPTGDSVLDEAVVLIKDFGKLKTAKYWVQKLSSKLKKLQERLANRLVEKNILRKEERKFLWVIPYNRYPTEDPATEQDIRFQIHDIIINNKPVTGHTAALLSLVKACDLVKEVFEKDERKIAKVKIKEIAEKEPIGKAVSSVVNEVNAAVIAAVAASVAASSATSAAS